LKEECRLSWIYVPKRDKVTGKWRRLQNKELCTLYYLSNTIRVVKIKKNDIGRTCRVFGEEEFCIEGFDGKPEGRKPLGRPRRRWGDNIEMDSQEVEMGAWA
jgi:hypothetical protein